MTMHLLGPAWSTTNSRQRKGKLTDTQFTKYAFDWRDDCKRAKSLGIKPKTLEEYVAYRQGKYKPNLRGTKAPQYTPSDHRAKYPSQSEIGVAFARKENQYTGNKLLGIATMHKSNMVPVFSREDAEEISKMRRN